MKVLSVSMSKMKNFSSMSSIVCLAKALLNVFFGFGDFLIIRQSLTNRAFLTNGTN